MTSDPELTQAYSGRVAYLPDYGSDPDVLLVAIPCLIQGRGPVIYALLDTASTWSLLPAPMADELGCNLTPDPRVPTLRTARFGRIRGRWEQIWIRFPADDGAPADALVTFYLSEDWQGPFVIGWKGGLEGMRFGLDPAGEWFYFAGL